MKSTKRCAALNCARRIREDGRCDRHQGWAPGWNPPEWELGLLHQSKPRNRVKEAAGEQRQAAKLAAILAEQGHDPVRINWVIEMQRLRRRAVFDSAFDGLS